MRDFCCSRTKTGLQRDTVPEILRYDQAINCWIVAPRLGEESDCSKTSDSILNLHQRAAARGVPYPCFPANDGKPLTKDFASGGANPVRGLHAEPGTETAHAANL